MVRFTKRYKYSRMKGGKKRRRKTIRKHKRRKKTKKQKRRRRRRTRRRMKGGSSKGLIVPSSCSGLNCVLPQNVGKLMTGHNIQNPIFPDPMSLNRNVRNPISPKPFSSKKGGRKRQRKRGRKAMKGGFFWDDWGLGDGLLAYYKGTDAAINAKHLYAGNKPEMSSTPSHQPELLKKPESPYSTPNLPDMYQSGAKTAADYTPKE